jgi:uncharacterized protein (TIGR02444 family)
MGSPFWDFSIAVYGAAGVQDECLALQDRCGLDVNLVLLCAYLGAIHGVALTEDDISSARREVGPWQEQIVRPLRDARRNLKTIALQNADAADSAAQLRQQVKNAELESERIEQRMLEKWAEARLAAWPRARSREAVAANLQILLAVYGIGSERLIAAQATAHLIAAALDRVVDK